MMKSAKNSVVLVKIMNKNLTVKCPTCEKEFNYYSSEYRPFCSEKCRMIDLGHWFKESYTVPVKKQNPEKDNDINENEKPKNHPNDGEDDQDSDSEYL
jgi:endogenous inhibitor of DNA gyrase (YacG/DUF329 family)